MRNKIITFLSGHSLFLLLPFLVLIIFYITTNLIVLSRVVTENDIANMLNAQGAKSYYIYYGEVLSYWKKYQAPDAKNSTRKNIQIIGRGSIDIGIDFSGIKAENLKYDRLRKRIIIMGVGPKVLSVNVNPWFIPQKKIKGFEIIGLQGQRLPTDFRYTQLQEIKSTIERRLISQCLKGDPLKKVQTMAQQEVEKIIALAFGDQVSVEFVESL